MGSMADSFAPTVADARLLAAGDPAAVDEPNSSPAAASARVAARAGPRQWLRDALLLVSLAGLIALAWQISEWGWVRPQERLGYWVGVAGASMMVLLFLYPLRKYAGWMRRLGKVKGWFWFHLAMGVAGPWLILVHAAFRTGSLNATVALYSMAVVVASGVVGRFLYVRLNSHLEDALAALQAVQRRGRLAEEGGGASALHYAPAVERRLKDFETRELGGAPRRLRDLRQVLLLPLQCRFALWRCLHDLRSPLAARAAAGRWSADELARRRRRAQRLIDDHLQAVVLVAHRQAFGRVFALWHVAHLPFIYLLVISAVVHVIAVHAY